MSVSRRSEKSKTVKWSELLTTGLRLSLDSLKTLSGYNSGERDIGSNTPGKEWKDCILDSISHTLHSE